MARGLDLAAVGAHLRGLPGWALAAPTALMLLNAAFNALRLRVLLGALGVAAGRGEVLVAVLEAHALALALPAGGVELGRAGLLTRRLGRPEAVVAALGAARVLELLPWGALLLYGLARGLAGRDPLLAAVAAGFAAAFFGVVGLAGATLWLGRAPTAEGAGPLRRGLAGVVRSALALRGQRRALALALALTLPLAPLNLACVALVLRALEVPMPFAEVAAVFPAADVLISLPLSLGGVGVREGVFARVLGSAGVGAALAVSASTLRWTGELGRAALGGLLLVVEGGRRRA